MNHQTTRKFWGLFDKLTSAQKVAAKRAYLYLKRDPTLVDFDHKYRLQNLYVRVPIKTGGVQTHVVDVSIVTARIDGDYRAIGFEYEMTCTWFWIGPHGDYERILNGTNAQKTLKANAITFLESKLRRI